MCVNNCLYGANSKNNYRFIYTLAVEKYINISYYKKLYRVFAPSMHDFISDNKREYATPGENI